MKRLFILIILLAAWVSPASAQSGIEYSEIAHLGRGTAETLDWRPDGEVLAIGGSAGLWLYDADFEQIAHFEVGSVQHVAWSPEGDKIAASVGSEVQIWAVGENSRTVNHVRVFIEPNGFSVSHISWNPNGRQLVINSHDENYENMTGYTWDYVLNEAPRIIRDAGFELEWSPDGTLLASGLEYEGVGMWDAATGRRLQTLNGVESDLFFADAEFSPDGNMLAAVTSLPASLHIWDIAAGALVNTPDTTREMEGLRRVEWSPDGRSIAVVGGAVEGRRYQAVEIFDADMWERTHNLSQPDGIWDIAWTPDSQRITAIGNSRVIYDWSIETEANIQYPLHYPPIQVATWSPDSTRIAVSTAGESSSPVMVWNVDDDEVSARYEPDTIFYPHITQTISWTPDSESIVTFGKNLPIWIAVYFVYQWDSHTGEFQDRLLEVADQGGPMPVVDWTHDFSRIAISWIDFDSFRVAESWQGEDELEINASEEVITEIMWSPDDSKIATLSADDDSDAALLEIWNASTGERLSGFEATNWRSTLTWSLDSESLSLVVPDEDGETCTLHVIDAATGEPYFMHEYESPVSALWSPDSSRLALDIGGYGDEVYVLQIVDSASGEILAARAFDGPLGGDWHPSGDLLAVATQNTLLFVDGVTGETLESAAVEGITSALWSPDGTRLALFNADQTIRVWQISLD